MNSSKWWSFRYLSRALSRAHSTVTTTTTSSPQLPPPTSFPLKHVTKSNFETALADLRNHVRCADFVAIDLEMTGITSAPWRDTLEFDRFDVRYLKVKDSAEKFAVIQFGVCPFRWDPLSESFIAHPHNFFVFPRQELPFDGPSHEFLCQTASLDFLARYQFDFNTCIHEGVSYLSRGQEEEALRHLNTQYEDEELNSWRSLKEAREIPSVRMADVLFAERMKDKLSEWRDGILQKRNGRSPVQENLDNSSQRFQTIFFKMRPSICLNGFTSHQLRLIRSVTKKHFRDLSYVHLTNDHSTSQELVVYTDLDEDKCLLMKEVKDERRKVAETKIRAATGFRHVIDLLSSEKKLIVGHNCLLDIAHLYSKFFGPLPMTVENFACSVNKHFPRIIDTKVLLNANDVLQLRLRKSRTSLSSAFTSLCSQMAHGSISGSLLNKQCVKVDVEVDNIRSSNWICGSKHEAGYDAFMTGCVFAQACSYMGIDFKLHSPSESLANHENLQKHTNLLYLCWINSDIIDLTTGQINQEPAVSSTLKSRHATKFMFENIALLWGFPSKLKANEIKECISKVFGLLSVTSVYHIDETAAFVHFSKSKFVSEFLALKHNLEISNDPISVLHPLSKLLEGGNTRAGTYEAYKQICSSPISKILFSDQAEEVGIKWKTELVESQSTLAMQEHESGADEVAVTTKSNSSEKSRIRIENVRNDSTQSRFARKELIDSLGVSNVKHIRTTKL